MYGRLKGDPIRWNLSFAYINIIACIMMREDKSVDKYSRTKEKIKHLIIKEISHLKFDEHMLLI